MSDHSSMNEVIRLGRNVRIRWALLGLAVVVATYVVCKTFGRSSCSCYTPYITYILNYNIF